MTREHTERLVYTVPEAARLLGLGRNAAYDAAKRGDIPTVRIGKLLFVPKIPLQRMLGVVAAPAALAAKPYDIFGEAGKAKNESSGI
jgi:excisionase family DNA binding protein